MSAIKSFRESYYELINNNIVAGIYKKPMLLLLQISPIHDPNSSNGLVLVIFWLLSDNVSCRESPNF